VTRYMHSLVLLSLYLSYPLLGLTNVLWMGNHQTITPAWYVG